MASRKPLHPNWVLATCILASSLAFVDGSVTNVALPAIGKSLQAGAADLQWVINAYLLPLSALLLLGGAAGDRYGRKRLLVAGTLLFAAASMACAAAPSLTLLLVGRGLQGVGAAVLMPCSLAILGASFSGEARGRAIGIWASMGAVMAATALAQAVAGLEALDRRFDEGVVNGAGPGNRIEGTPTRPAGRVAPGRADPWARS